MACYVRLLDSSSRECLGSFTYDADAADEDDINRREALCNAVDSRVQEVLHDPNSYRSAIFNSTGFTLNPKPYSPRNNVIAGAAAGAIILGISVIAAIFYFRRKKRYSNTTVINTTVVTPGQSFLPPIQMWTPAPSAPTTQPDSHLSP